MMASQRVTTFANTFLVTGPGRGRPVLKVVGPEETRKKRPHRKSRLGCIRCKKRKVKCDEGDPCRNCVKRGETCIIRRSPASSNRGEDGSPPVTSPPPEVAWCPLSEPECGPINLLHMELLHHFERHTMHTLSFKEIWPRMLQLAFQSQQHTYLVNAMLAIAAAHLDYLVPGKPQYHRAKYALLNKALHDYREKLSAPITADNCDALLGTAYLVHFLTWCDLSFMDGQDTASTNQPLDLSGDRLYWLSTGIRQIFFMAWPLFQTTQSVFMRVGILQPCMALEDVVDARGLNWRRYERAFMALYDNPRYQGGRDAFTTTPSSTSSHSFSESPHTQTQSPISTYPPTPSTPSPSSTDHSTAFLEGMLDLPFSSAPPFKVMTLWQSYKEGEAYVNSCGAHDEGLMRAAYKRIVARLAVAMAFIADGGVADDGRPGPASGVGGDEGAAGRGQAEVREADIVRYVSVFPMMCFGPLLALISSGDSRMLVVLYHIYRTVGALLPGETYWWCKRRGEAMEEAIGRELKFRGVEVCLRKQSELA